MADTNQQLNNLTPTTPGPTLEGTLNSLNNVQAGSAYADYINSIYNAGLALQDSGSSLVKNTTIQFNDLIKQSKDLFTANPDATRTDTLEMNAAINNSLKDFTTNTFNNRDILQNNATNWFQTIGNVITDESFAKAAGERLWNDMSGNDKEKYQQMTDIVTKTDDNEYFDIFFDENERKNINELNRDGSQQASYFDDSWKEAFTPQDYDKDANFQDRGLIGTMLFGGGYGPISSTIGGMMNFFIWDPIKFMTIDLVKNTWDFTTSIFDKEKGLDLGAAVTAGLAMGSWALMGHGSKVAASLDKRISMSAETKLESMAAKDIATSLTDDAVSVIGDDVFNKASQEFSQGIETKLFTDLETGADSSISSVLDNSIDKTGKSILSESTRIIARDEIESKFGKSAVKHFDDTILKYDETIKKDLLSKINKGELTTLDDLAKHVNVDKLKKTGVLTESEASKITSNAEKLRQREIYGLDNSIEGHAADTFKQSEELERMRLDKEVVGKKARREASENIIIGNKETDDIIKIIDSKAFKNTDQLVQELLKETGSGRIARNKLKMKYLRNKDTSKLARKIMNKRTRIGGLSKKRKFGIGLLSGAAGRTVYAAATSLSQVGQDFDQRGFWYEFFVSQDAFDLGGTVPDISNYQSVGDATTPEVIQNQLEEEADPGEGASDTSAEQVQAQNAKRNRLLLKSFRL